ncbi:MAG: HlyD family efflux transporter periplasmic adaptor subunit, partial [Rhodospirillales bacterium]|nr:HlyD family efflux transporter periplasmic adaptor subunit [Rhodospirillales bacterium]
KVSPTLQGRLITVSVARGDDVAAHAPLFAQDPVEDRAARDKAKAELEQAREKLADLQAAGRSPEILQARADVTDMQAAYDRVARDLARDESLLASGGVSRQTVEQLREDTRSAKARLDSAQAKYNLITDPSGRQHAIAAQQAAVDAAAADLASAQWRLDQRSVVAPTAGRIADTYAEPGEVVDAGVPVVSLLPPGNIFVRFFIPETALARIHPGQQVGINCDSCPPGLTARISFVATSAEYTPPVIYSQGTRGSLVYLIEARPDPARHPLLKPGQPVDVSPPKGAQAR